MHGNSQYYEQWASASRRLQDLIVTDGCIPRGAYDTPIYGFLDVSMGINHVVDIGVLAECAEAFAQCYNQRYPERKIDFVLTVESSGIPFVTLLAERFNSKLIFARKKGLEEEKINGREAYTARARSFTKGRDYICVVAKEALPPGKTVLVGDDFIATSEASGALWNIVEQAGADLAGIVALITKDIPGQEGWKELTRRVNEYNSEVLSAGQGLMMSLNTAVRITEWPKDAGTTAELTYAEPCLSMP